MLLLFSLKEAKRQSAAKARHSTSPISRLTIKLRLTGAILSDQGSKSASLWGQAASAQLEKGTKTAASQMEASNDFIVFLSGVFDILRKYC